MLILFQSFKQELQILTMNERTFGELTATATIEKVGRKVIFVNGSLYDKNGKVYATANSTELVVEVPLN